MKYVIILPDGVADVPVKELKGKTPLEVATHPHLDRIAREGVTGWVHTIPQGFAPGSDVGCMSVFGYDPRQYHTGRAPLEAAAQGIALQPGDVAFRCNTVTVEENVMVDYSAGHIDTADSAELIKSLNDQCGNTSVRFYPGVGYRHLRVVRGAAYAKTSCTPPHDISGQSTTPHLPKGPGAELLLKLMCESAGIFKAHPVTARRVGQGKRTATQVWFWGQGTAVSFPPFQQVYGKKAACISAVDIVRGIGRLAGMKILQVPGITGYFDTNYEAKAEHALKALDDGYEFVLIHVESTDEAGHMGDVQKKIQAIEDVDRRLVRPLLEGLKRRGEPHAVLVTPDHPTSVEKRTHIADAVPFALLATGLPPDAVMAYNESAVQASTKRFERGFELMSFFLQQGQS
jgi:2,3-bisphosphoglycerate-independent phosphoglycerate mutase